MQSNHHPPLNYMPHKTLLLEMAQEHGVDALLEMIVRRLSKLSHVALVRIWLIKQGDCPCPMQASTCDEQAQCLHLVASRGRSRVDDQANWSRLDGEFSRFALGSRKVGWIAATGKAVEVNDIQDDSQWIARPQWARKEGIVGFGGQPLLYKGEVLGVLAVFTRSWLEHEELVWVRMIADHAATAIVNARAFEQIHRLQEQLELECSYLREEVNEARAFGEIVGRSEALHSTLQQVDLVAPTDANVLILGESGTGKELIAREIHQRSGRQDRPLIKVNCASISRELYESEFFGHAKGAFSGAVADRAGRFEAADGGTLFLDEVGEIPTDLQSKLLRVLQEGQYERVGEEVTRQVDVRIIAATNRNLKAEVAKGRFRQDLYYRLNVFPVEVAPLRLRKADIPPLADHFLDLIRRRINYALPSLSSAQIKQLKGYDWPGNVRELQNVIERAAITARGGQLVFILPDEQPVGARLKEMAGQTGTETAEPVLPDSEMRRLERENTLSALKASGWRIYGNGGAAQLLGIKPTTLASRMKKMRIKKPPA